MNRLINGGDALVWASINCKQIVIGSSIESASRQKRAYVRLCLCPALAQLMISIDPNQFLLAKHSDPTTQRQRMDDTQQPAPSPNRRPACRRLLGRRRLLLLLFPAGIVAVALQLPSLATATAFVPHAAPHAGAWTLLGSQVSRPQSPNPIGPVDPIECPQQP